MMELFSSSRRYNPVVAEWFRGLIVNGEKINRLTPVATKFGHNP